MMVYGIQTSCRLFPWKFHPVIAAVPRVPPRLVHDTSARTYHPRSHIRMQHHDGRHDPRVHVPEHVTGVVVPWPTGSVRMR